MNAEEAGKRAAEAFDKHFAEIIEQAYQLQKDLIEEAAGKGRFNVKPLDLGDQRVTTAVLRRLAKDGFTISMFTNLIMWERPSMWGGK